MKPKVIKIRYKDEPTKVNGKAITSLGIDIVDMSTVDVEKFTKEWHRHASKPSVIINTK